VGNKRGSKEKAIELKSVSVFLCTEVVKIRVGKSSVVPGLRQGTVSREKEVTRFCPSGPRPGEENSTRTLPKFRKWDTSEGGWSRIWGGENEVLTKGDGELPGLAMEDPSLEAFPFLSTASGSVSGVARGNCG
jgi:hypothetical protein